MATKQPSNADIAEQLTRVEWKLDRMMFGRNTPEGHYRDSQQGRLHVADGGAYANESDDYLNPLRPPAIG